MYYSRIQRLRGMSEERPLSWLVPDWPAPAAVRAISTTREGGLSTPPYDSFNLGEHVGEASDVVMANRMRLCSVLSLHAEPAWLKQVHGNTVIDCAHWQLGVEADASVAFSAASVCAVQTADCLPVLFCDVSATCVAAAHAGWRGLAAGVLEATVEALELPANRVMAWLGPAIGAEVFEVGDEVRQQFVSYDAEAEVAFRPSGSDRWLADIYQLARLRLRSIGVDAVYGGGLCTYSDAQRFYSYRRDGANTGRMASLIWLGNL